MNADEFYEEFRAALGFLGATWADKPDVEVWIDERQRVCLSYRGKQARLSLPLTDPEDDL
jgi:hypothetical protein